MTLDLQNTLSYRFDYMPSLNFYAQECPWMILNEKICATPDFYVQDIDDFNICVRLEDDAENQCQTARKPDLKVKVNKCILRKLSPSAMKDQYNNQEYTQTLRTSKEKAKMSIAEIEKEELKMKPFGSQAADAELTPECSKCKKPLTYIRIDPNIFEDTDELEQLQS